MCLQIDDAGPLTPRLSDITGVARKGRLSLGATGGDGNFSDYNPFQSGGEETPQRDTKRRKVRLVAWHEVDLVDSLTLHVCSLHSVLLATPR